MGIDLFLVFFLEAEDDLDGNDALFGSFDSHRGVDGNWGEEIKLMRFLIIGVYGAYLELYTRIYGP
jgi:hypothetical protein